MLKNKAEKFYRRRWHRDCVRLERADLYRCNTTCDGQRSIKRDAGGAARFRPLRRDKQKNAKVFGSITAMNAYKSKFWGIWQREEG